MKPYFLTILALSTLLCMSCNPSKKQEDNNSAETMETEAPKGNSIDLKQNGDYSTLFHATDDNCPLLTVTEIENALSLSSGSVELGDSPCVYIITLNDGSKSPLSIRVGKLTGTTATNAIESYVKDNTGILSAVISETGDSYLCTHRSRGSLTIYNTSYDTYINMNFSTMVFAAAHKKDNITVTPGKIVRENAVKVANQLLKKYKK